MIHGIWELFLTLINRENTTNTEDGSSRFVPSPLDLSVRIGHGGADDDIQRELTTITERATTLEDTQRNT